MAIMTYKLHLSKLLEIYNMLIDRDLLNKIGLTLDFSTETIPWNNPSVPMKNHMSTMIESFHINDPKEIDNMVGHAAGDRYKNY